MGYFPRLSKYKNNKHRNDAGWTSLELMISIGVVGVIGSIATVKMINNSEGNVSNAVAQIFLGDLAFAQNLAMSTNKGVVMTFSSGCDDGENDRHHGRGHGHDWRDRQDEDNHGHARGHEQGHGQGNDDRDREEDDDDHDHGNGNDDDDHGNGNGNNGNGNGHGNNGNGNGNRGNGHGQGQDDDDDHDNGYGNDDDQGNHGGRPRCHGRGHGRGYGHHHNCDDGCDDSAGGYVMTFADGSPLPYPAAASMTTVDAPVTIAATTTNFRFDSVGRFIVPGYQWAPGQTSLIVMTINNKVGIQVTRETGKASIVTL